MPYSEFLLAGGSVKCSILHHNIVQDTPVIMEEVVNTEIKVNYDLYDPDLEHLKLQEKARQMSLLN
jgi:hypothetical protein